MKIARIEQFFPRARTRLVKITTDNGLVGWGETTLEGKPRSVAAAIDELADYLLGADPLLLEHHWQHIYRSAFYRGGPVLMTALSGIDQALWEIACAIKISPRVTWSAARARRICFDFSSLRSHA
jgi:galactonate dehydratase